MIVAVFVDDGMIFAKKLYDIEFILEEIKKTFLVKVSAPDMFIGMQIVRDGFNKTLFIHQNAYARQVVSRFDMQDHAPLSTPCDPNITLCAPKVLRNINVPYRELVGALMFMVVVSRPDLSFIVNVLSRYCNNPHYNH